MTFCVDGKTKTSCCSRRRALEMNPSSMNWIPQETTMASTHGSPAEKRNSLTLESISFCAAKFKLANASLPRQSVEVLLSNGSNCACRDASLRWSSRTEIGLWNARNLRDVAASNAGPPYIVDFIAASPSPSERETCLLLLISPRCSTSSTMDGWFEHNRVRTDEISFDFSNNCRELTDGGSEENLKVIFGKNASINNLAFTEKIENKCPLKAEKVSTSEESKTSNHNCITNGRTCENQSYQKTNRKHSIPRLPLDVGKNESISVNSSSGSSERKGTISFRLKGISEHGQGHPNAISRRTWKVNVSRNYGQSLADGQVSAAPLQSAAPDCPSSVPDSQFSSIGHQSFLDCQLSPMNCQPSVENCNSSVRCQSSVTDWQSSAKDLQSSAKDLQSTAKDWQSSAKDWQSSSFNWKSSAKKWQSSAKKWQSSAKTCQSPSENRQPTASRRSHLGCVAASRVLLTFLVLTVLNFQATSAKIRSRDGSDPVSNIRHVLPELELGNNSVTDVRFNEGSTAFLPCRFPTFPRHHENRVSWIRRWDWHILTAGVFTYTNDDRFVVLHKDGTNDWTLQIKFLQTQDNGTYECQVHTGSGFMSQFVNLFVITPRAAILEPREFTIETGQDFSLTCVIQQTLEPPVYVMWLHGGVPVNYAPDRPRLNVDLIVKGSTSRSILSVKNAKYSDSGNYTCTAPNAVNAWVLVYVTQGDTVAAVQRRQPNSSRTVPPDVDGAPALPSKTNAAVPLVNIFVIPFVSILTRCSAFLGTDFLTDLKDLHYHFTGAGYLPNVPTEELFSLNPELLKRNTEQLPTRERMKLGEDKNFAMSSPCKERANLFTYLKRLKFLADESTGLSKIDLLLSACIYVISFQLITSFLLERYSEIKVQAARPKTPVFCISPSSHNFMPNMKRSPKIQTCTCKEPFQISCSILNDSARASR